MLTDESESREKNRYATLQGNAEQAVLHQEFATANYGKALGFTR